MSAMNPPPPRSVRFSDFSQLVLIPNDGIDQAFSKDFREDTAQAIHSARERLSGTQFTDQEDIEYMGLEMYLEPGLATLVGERKRAHLQAIIKGQHVLSKDDLSKLSAMTSRWCRDRARDKAKKHKSDE